MLYAEKKIIRFAQKQTTASETLPAQQACYLQGFQTSQAFFETRGLLLPIVQEQHFKQFRKLNEKSEVIIVLYYTTEQGRLSHQLNFYQNHDIFRQDFVTVAEMNITYLMQA